MRGNWKSKATFVRKERCPSKATGKRIHNHRSLPTQPVEHHQHLVLPINQHQRQGTIECMVEDEIMDWSERFEPDDMMEVDAIDQQLFTAEPMDWSPVDCNENWTIKSLSILVPPDNVMPLLNWIYFGIANHFVVPGIGQPHQ